MPASWILPASSSVIVSFAGDEGFVVRRVEDVFLDDAADDAVAERLEDLAALDDRRHDDPVDRAAVFLRDDDVLRDVDETAREVAGVGRLERRVGEALARAVRRDEVLEHGEAFAEVRDDRLLHDLARGLGHGAAHAGELPDLLLRASRAGVGHHVDGVELPAADAVRRLHFLEHGFRHGLGDAVPDVDDLVVALAVRDGALLALVLDLEHFLARAVHELGLVARDAHVVDADRDAGLGRDRETESLHDVEDLDGALEPVGHEAVVDEVLEALLLQRAVQERQLGRQVRREQDAPDRRLDARAVAGDRVRVDDVLVVEDLALEVDEAAREAHRDPGVRVDLAGVVRERDLVEAREDAAFALAPFLAAGEVVEAEDEVLRRHREGLAVRGRQDVVRGQHQDLRLDLRLRRERDVDGHLVAVEVRVERRADERVDLDRLALDEDRLERLDAEAVERRRAVQENRVLLDDFLESVPHLVRRLLDELLGRLDRGRDPLLLEPVVDERLEELEGHLLRQAALVELELRPDDDDGAARVVDALAEEVLAEAARLALERVGQRLEGAVVRALEDAAAATVVEQGVDGLLEHALLVAHDDFGRAELEQLLEAVVAVDDAAVEVVEVRRGKPASVQGDERTKLGGNDRDDVQDHPLRAMTRAAERVDDLETLGRLEALERRRLRLHDEAQLLGQVVDVDALEELLDRLGAHLGDERVDAVLDLELAELLFRDQALDLEVLVLRERARVDDDVLLEVEDPLEVAEREVEQVPDAARQPLEEPDVRHGRRELDVAHALAPDLRLRDLDAALVADDAAVLHPLVLAAEAFPVGDRAEDLRAEQAVAFRLERAVVDRLGLRHLAERPRADLLGAGEGDLDGVEVTGARVAERRHRAGAGETRKRAKRLPCIPLLLRPSAARRRGRATAARGRGR